MSKFCRSVDERGFTLMELLIAIFVFSVVISTVYGSYRTTFTNIRIAENQADLEARARVILERVVLDLESVVAGESGFLFGEQEEIGDHRGDAVQFLSTAHLVFSRGEANPGLAEIGYSLEEDEETGLLTLFRSDRVFVPGGEEQEEDEEEDKGPVLGREILEFRLTYFDQEGSENEGWESSQEGENGKEVVILPVMVRVDLRLAENPEDETGRLFRTAAALPRGAGEDS